MLALGLAVAAAATINVQPGESIQAAVDAADPGDRVVVHEGTYREAGRPCPGAPEQVCAVVIRKDGIRLVGRDAVLRADGEQSTGIFVGRPAAGGCSARVRRSRLAGVAVVGFAQDGVRLSCVKRWRVTRTEVGGNGEAGIVSLLTARGRLDHNVVDGNRSGIYLQQSRRARVDHNRSEENLSGFELENSERIRLVRNVAAANTAGILSFARPGLERDRNARNLIRRNVVSGNRPNTCTTAGELACSLPSGTGVLLLAADRTRVLRNQVVGNRTVGIVVANFCVVNGVPAEECSQLDIEPNPDRNRVRDNEVSGNGFDPDLERLPLEQFAVDLAWDTSGTGNCWSGNGNATRFPDPLPTC